MRVWDFAYRSARRGEWETFARDRDRFKKIINRIGNVLHPILDSQHRMKVHKGRFEKSCDENSNSLINL